MSEGDEGNGSKEIRRLIATDAADYRVLILDAYERFSEAFTSTAGERRALPLAWWEKRIAAPDGTSVAFGAFVGRVLVGTVGLEFETREKTKHKSSLLGMFVKPEYRGRGLARLLVDAAVRHAEGRPGSVVMRLQLTGGNDAAQKLYESCGFATFGVEPMGLCNEGTFRDKVHMWRKLGEVVGR